MGRHSGGQAAAAVLLAAGPAEAHAFALRYDLPLPLWLYVAGAGATVAVSFGLIAWLAGPGRPPVAIDLRDTFLGRIFGAPIRALLRLLAVGLFHLALREPLYGFVGLLFAIFVLFYAWGPRDLDLDIDAILNAPDAASRCSFSPPRSAARRGRCTPSRSERSRRR